MQSFPPVSVIMPLLNEERHLADAVDMVLAQDYRGELEVVLALGPSRDRTDEVAERVAAADPRVRLVRNPSGRTPDGLNAAIGAATGEVVVRVDGHAEIPTDYVSTAVAELVRVGADNVGGIMDAQGSTDFERAVAAAMRSPLGVGASRFHTGGSAGESDTVYLGVFRREALERVGGYDPHFARAQDWEMNHRIRQTGGTVWFTPDLRVTYRPRGSFRTLARQYFHYGRWRRVVAAHHEGTINARYLAPPTMVVLTAAGLVAGVLWAPAWVVPAGYVVGVTVGGLAISGGEPVRTRALTPAVLATMHWAWGVGFLTSPRRLIR
ncbi:cellulose synthase/poly-beta-1,6-N-acetylglucosamine synthase-like glycosyltransferase [Terracoccus luteus]|uniref:Cellulose synthase/poly-beta-1,6-N-acetylglucosamine synthase-like glycosyltransferase n=1 Tax=Terracoccus luteus TaxID=53356 RepID=A0A495XTL8_9MICO|nr:glycosyltransferase family 2 protein [Terracoccus luteus]RKT77272.1 cellulose synthase/poly-beta-1,6-N-acetylglucosamine synthase-like glycosyltransferase [Terracoccus luteus]